MLTPLDCINLLALSEGNNPLWSPDSRYRCEQLGLIDRRLLLTPLGDQKVDRIRCYVKALKNGIPLDQRSGNKEADAWAEEWKQLVIMKKTCLVHDSMLIMKHHRHSVGRYPLLENGNGENFKLAAVRILSTKDLRVFQPTHYQIEDLGGRETIVLSPTIGDGIIRIQTKYYDLMTNQWGRNITFVQRAECPENPVLARLNDRTCGIRDGFVGLIYPIVCPTWPQPE
jgi:hypothetical protein